MNKIIDKLARFWVFTVKNRLRKRITFKGFEVEFREYDLRIKSLGGNFAMKVRCTEHSYGYLVSALAQNKLQNIHGYASIMYSIATNICKDEIFADKIQGDVIDFIKRMEAIKPNKEEELDEESSLALVQRTTEFAKMSRQQRRKAERKYNKILKKIDNE